MPSDNHCAEFSTLRGKVLKGHGNGEKLDGKEIIFQCLYTLSKNVCISLRNLAFALKTFVLEILKWEKKTYYKAFARMR